MRMAFVPDLGSSIEEPVDLARILMVLDLEIAGRRVLGPFDPQCRPVPGQNGRGRTLRGSDEGEQVCESCKRRGRAGGPMRGKGLG